MKKVRFIRTIRCTIHLKPKALEPTAYRILLVASTKRVKGAPKKRGSFSYYEILRAARTEPAVYG